MLDGEWYLLYVSSGHEEQARRNLQQRIKYMDVGDLEALALFGQHPVKS